MLEASYLKYCLVIKFKAQNKIWVSKMNPMIVPRDITSVNKLVLFPASLGTESGCVADENKHACG